MFVCVSVYVCVRACMYWGWGVGEVYRGRTACFAPSEQWGPRGVKLATDDDTADVIRMGWGLTDALCLSVCMWEKWGGLRVCQVGVKGETLINTVYHQ